MLLDPDPYKMYANPKHCKADTKQSQRERGGEMDRERGGGRGGGEMDRHTF